MALYLPAHSLRDAPLSPVTNINSSSNNSFATATTKGWTIYKLNPLTTISNRGKHPRQLPAARLAQLMLPTRSGRQSSRMDHSKLYSLWVTQTSPSS